MEQHSIAEIQKTNSLVRITKEESDALLRIGFKKDVLSRVVSTRREDLGKSIHELQVKAFFDHLAANYNQRFEKNNIFLSYFLQERIWEATQDINFNRKNILDIGAGTGILFDWLSATFFENYNYYASDISAKMLEYSNIPPSNFIVGKTSNIVFPNNSFDLIFLLGVTSYMNSGEFNYSCRFIQKHLNVKGTAILSFTNRTSFDFQIRRFTRSITRLLGFKKKVMGQPFKIYAYSPQEIQNIFGEDFHIEKITFLNQTFPPFNRIFPKLSIHLAKFFKKHITSPRLLSILSSDFLIFIRRKM